jgi:hypothetical protein
MDYDVNSQLPAVHTGPSSMPAGLRGRLVSRVRSDQRAIAGQAERDRSRFCAEIERVLLQRFGLLRADFIVRFVGTDTAVAEVELGGVFTLQAARQSDTIEFTARSPSATHQAGERGHVATVAVDGARTLLGLMERTVG